MGLLEHRLDVFDGLAPLHPRMPQHARAELGPEGMRGNGPGTGAEQVREVGGGVGRTVRGEWEMKVPQHARAVKHGVRGGENCRTEAISLNVSE